MSDLTAIDVLMQPDPEFAAFAKAANARLRGDYPEGFALDAHHVPHVTLLQRYVRTSDLDRVYAAVARTLGGVSAIGGRLDATGYSYVLVGGFGIMGIDLRRTPNVDALHGALIEAIAPFSEDRGTAAAFATTPKAPDIIAPTIQYVREFVPKFSGARYSPHVTIGLGREPLLKTMAQEAFAPLAIEIAGVAVYQVGEFGTAQRKLWESGR